MSKWAVARRAMVALALGLLLPSATALATGANPYTGAGADVSYPECSSLPAQGPGAFAIIGATGGKAFTSNNCLAQEVAWARHFSAPITFYVNLNYPVGSTASQGLSGRNGSCQRSDKACQAHNYGYNAAAYAVGQAQTTGATVNGTWWLDIETANSWSAQPNLNSDVIQGALAYFSDHTTTAGVYSTSAMWTKIAGSYSPALPNWVVATSGGTCTNPTFGNGYVWLVQSSSGTAGGDQACT